MPISFIEQKLQEQRLIDDQKGAYSLLAHADFWYNLKGSPEYKQLPDTVKWQLLLAAKAKNEGGLVTFDENFNFAHLESSDLALLYRIMFAYSCEPIAADSPIQKYVQSMDDFFVYLISQKPAQANELINALKLGEDPRLNALIGKLETQTKVVQMQPHRTIKAYEPESPQELLAKATRFFEKEKIKNRKRSFDTESAIATGVPLNSERELLSILLQKNKGILIAENHSHESPKDFLLKYMPCLKEAGVEVIFMEQFLHHHQKDLNEFCAGKTLSAQLKSRIYNSRYTYGYEALAKAAKANNIRIVAIDHTYAFKDDRKRCTTMDYFAYKVMKQEIAQLQGKKFVALAGENHVWGSIREKTPGLMNLLQVPGLAVRDMAENERKILLPIRRSVLLPIGGGALRSWTWQKNI